MFMTEFPDGPLWKHKQDLQGHQYPKNLKSAKKAQRDVTGNIEKSLLLYDEDNVNDDDKYMAQQEIPLISQDIPLEDIPENSD